MKIHDVVYVYHLDEKKLKEWHSRVHSHVGNLYELHYFVSGKGNFKNGDVSYTIKPGMVFLTYPGQVHGIRPDEGNKALTYYAVLFEFQQARDAPMADISDTKIVKGFPLILDPLARITFEEVKSRYNSDNKFFQLSAEYELVSFILEMVGRITDEASRPQNRSTAADVYVSQAMELFQEKINDQVRLEDIASLLGISEEYLIRIFRDRIGVTPSKYFSNLKLEASSSMLVNSTLSIKEIAYILSYSSQYHFSKSFRAFAGTSPSEYRNRYLTTNPTGYEKRIIGMT